MDTRCRRHVAATLLWPSDFRRRERGLRTAGLCAMDASHSAAPAQQHGWGGAARKARSGTLWRLGGCGKLAVLQPLPLRAEARLPQGRLPRRDKPIKCTFG